MRKIFQKWLLVCMCAVFVVSFGFTFWEQTKQAEENAATLMRIKIRDTQAQLAVNAENSLALRNITDQTAAAKTRVFAEMLLLDPGLARDNARLKELAGKIDVDELHVCDATGVITTSSEPNLVGYDLKSSPQSLPFMPAATMPDFILVQPPMPRGAEGTPYQYAGVSRLDEPGIVQVGFYPSRLQTAIAAAEVGTISNGLRIGVNGSILVLRANQVVGSAKSEWMGRGTDFFGLPDPLPQDSKPFWTRSDMGMFLCVCAEYDGYALAALFPENEVYAERDTYEIYIAFGNFLIFGAIFLLVSLLVQKTVITGIHKINVSLAKITKGDLHEKVEVSGNPEFVSLSTGINSMVEALRSAATEKERRMERELVLAKAIQQGALPNVLTTLPYRNEFDLFATMTSAKEVGGDFYDFFMIDSTHLGFTIADVSDKGIPAALFMMTAKAHIKNHMLSDPDLGDALTSVNALLCQDNQADMFVTCFAAVLDVTTGELNCVNAGHNPPLMAPSREEKYAPLSIKRHFVLGGMEGVRYSTSSMRIKPGASLLLFTDGVTEAINFESELYGDGRLLDFVNSDAVRPLSPKKLLSALKESIDAFAGGAEQADDITMLAMEYRRGVEA